MLEIKNLYIKAGSFWVEDISLKINDLEYFVLMGPTGSGKSLFIKSICGLLKVKSGCIIIDGEEITNSEPRFRGIGYVPQDSALFPHLNVEKNLTFPLDVSGQNKNRIKKKIAEIIDLLELGGILQRPTVTLSGRERQKVTLGRALTRSPGILILDEPVEGLDKESSDEVCLLLKKVKKYFGITAIHVCHSVDEAKKVSDRVGILSSGHLVQEGTIKDIIKFPANNRVCDILREDN